MAQHRLHAAVGVQSMPEDDTVTIDDFRCHTESAILRFLRSALHPRQRRADAHTEQHGNAVVPSPASNTHDALPADRHALPGSPRVSWLADGRLSSTNLTTHQ